jgi:hypothetical protein
MRFSITTVVFKPGFAWFKYEQLVGKTTTRLSFWQTDTMTFPKLFFID